MINSTIIIIVAISILAVIGIGVVWYLVKNRKTMGLESQLCLLFTTDGQLVKKVNKIFKDYVLDEPKMRAWLMLSQFRRWIQGKYETLVIIDEQSGIPYNPGLGGFDRPRYVKWGIDHIQGNGLAYKEWNAAFNRETIETNKDKMFELMKTSVLCFVFLAILVTCIVLGVNLWG